jgi:hypothetical protein
VKIQGMGMPLASVAHYCNCFVFECIKSGFIVVNYRCRA